MKPDQNKLNDSKESYQSNYDFDALEKATETLRAIAHPQRIQIIEMLHQMGEINVTEIQNNLEIEQAVVSHHLRILKDKDIVSVRRLGKNSLYSLSKRSYFDLISLLAD
jgi:DNA-binding transcriptional ArsR family regulator